MAERLVLHVGAMKSGTSYLQDLLFQNKQALAGRGVCVPGRDWTDQVHGVRQALMRRLEHRPRWELLLQEIHETPGTAVVSMEYLGPSSPAVARAVLGDLMVPQTRVVLTARDLNRTLVSMWQETIQNGRSWTWADYLADVRNKRPGTRRGVADRTTAGGTFWRQQHIARMAADWASVVGAQDVVLVTVPAPGARGELLAERFGRAAGITLDTTVPVQSANQSLGLASVLALRRLNELLDERGLAFPAGSVLRKRELAKTVLPSRRRLEPGLGLRVSDWVRDQAADLVDQLQGSGTSLVGDWEDLRPVDVPGVDPSSVSDAEVTEAALHALAGLVANRIGQ